MEKDIAEIKTKLGLLQIYVTAIPAQMGKDVFRSSLLSTRLELEEKRWM